MHTVVVTDFGEVTLGPKLSAFAKEQIEPGIDRRKNSRAYKAAARDLHRLETAVALLAEAEFRAGGVLLETV